MPPLATLRRIVPLQIEAAAAIAARFAPQLQVLQAAGETAHQRLDVAHLIGAIEIAEIGGRERFFAARAVPFGVAIVLARALPDRAVAIGS